MIRRLWARLARRHRQAAPAAPATREPPHRLGPFELRPAHPVDDRSALLAAYASSRDSDPELARRHPDSRQSVIEHEFESRQLSYPIDFPEVRFFLLEAQGATAGRCYIQVTPSDVFLVDLVLLPVWRGHGHGTAVLTDLIHFARSTRRSLRLHVAKNNPRAARLYDRLGFARAEELTHHWLLTHPAPHGPGPPPEPGGRIHWR